LARNEATISQEEVWEEHLERVHVGRHWAYLLGVILGALLVMIALIAVLGASGG